jgi:hypothetical protein
MAQHTLWRKSSFSGSGTHPTASNSPIARLLLLRGSDGPGTMIITTVTGLAALIRHLSR